MKFSNIIYPYVFQGHLSSCHYETIKSFHNKIHRLQKVLQKATHITISAKRPIKWKITNLTSSTPVRRLLCTEPPRKFLQSSFAQKLQLIGHSLTLTFQADVHSATNGPLWFWKPQHTYVKRAVR